MHEPRLLPAPKPIQYLIDPLKITTRQLVHDLTNHTQLVISYLEMNEPAKALHAAQDGLLVLERLTEMLGSVYEGNGIRSG